MANNDTFHFTTIIDGKEHEFTITPSEDGYQVEQNGILKSELNAERKLLNGELSPMALQSVSGWIMARY